MAGTPYLIDSNILIRWVQPADPDYAVVKSALDVLARQGAKFCYTSQNLAEFWTACPRPAERNGYGLSPQEADRRARLSPTARESVRTPGMAQTARRSRCL